MMVVCDEIIGFVRRLMSGIEITSETLALDVIDKVGPGGSYLTSAHTKQHFRDVWYPRVMDRHNYHGWMQAGQPTVNKTACDIARDAITHHQPIPLPGATLDILNSIVSEADKQAGIVQGPG
jgi:trimethylamine--corrinoid protein Co-methyltransferase